MKTVRLDHVATVRARIGWKALTAREYQDSGFTFLATPNIKTATIDFGNVNYISEFRYNESPELKLQLGDVLLAKDGSTLGITNVVRHLPTAATVNGSIAVLRPFAIESRYLMYALLSSQVQGWIQLVKDGMGVPHLFQSDIKRIRFRAPKNVDEQRRIADFLDDQVSRIDRIVAARREQQQLAASEYGSWLSLTSDNLILTNGDLSLRRVLKGIEQGWSPQASTQPADGERPGVIKLGAVRSGDFRWAENKEMLPGTSPNPRYLLGTNDLLVTRANTPDLVGDVAVITEIPHPGGLFLSDLVYRLRVDAEPGFISLALRSRRIREQMRVIARGTSQSMVKLRGEDLAELRIPDVGRQDQTRLARKDLRARARLSRTRSALSRSIALLTEYKQSLITAAVTGELDVTTASGRGTPA